MTAFVHVDLPLEHPGVVRLERAYAWFGIAINRLSPRRWLDAWARREAQRRLEHRRAQSPVRG